jgi:hypothetical protein
MMTALATVLEMWRMLESGGKMTPAARSSADVSPANT